MNPTNQKINELYSDIIKIFEYYKKNMDSMHSSIEYKKLVSYTKTFEVIIENVHSLSSYKNKNNLNKLVNFFTIKVVTEHMLKLFVAYSVYYYIKHNKNKKIGFDFEFNQGDIALWQIAYYIKTHQNKICYMFVIDPHILIEYKSIIITTVFTSPIKKIVHGADSLDLPYIFNNFFGKDIKLINKFIEKMSDTRFLCEYVKLRANEENKKCSIYDALNYFKVISDSEHEDLNKLTKSMGPIQDVNWDLKSMSSHHLKYAMYDVLFLERFLKNIYKMGEKIGITKKELNVVSQIDRFYSYEKYGILEVLQESKQIVDTVNNYFILKTVDSTQIKLIDIYDKVIAYLATNTKLSNFLKTIEINNFKKFITIVLKRIVYVLVSESYQIYENKKTIYTNKISYITIYDKLLKFKLVDLAKIIFKFTSEAKNYVSKFNEYNKNDI